MDAESIALDVLNSIENTKNRCNFLRDKRSELDKSLADIDHILEFCNLNAAERVQLANERIKLLKERRTIKDEYRLLNKLGGVFRKYQDFKDELNYVFNDIKNEVSRLNNRKCSANIRQDLFDRFSKENDNLVKSATHEELINLKETLERKNVS